MSPTAILDATPLWLLSLATILVCLLSVEAGFRLGRWARGRSAPETEAPVGSMVGAVLGLLAFLLAFTFGMAGDRYAARRALVLDEANAVGTAWLRAGLLPEPAGSEVRAMLREYVEVRLDAVLNDRVAAGIAESERLHQALWAIAQSTGQANPGSELIPLFIDSLNEVIDLHASRVTAGIRNRVPETIWIALFLLAILAMAPMGYHSGITGSRRTAAVLPLTIAFSVVIVLIADLDTPQRGLLTVNQAALQDVLTMMTRQGGGQ